MEDKVLRRRFLFTRDVGESSDKIWQRARVAMEHAQSDEEMESIFEDFKMQVKQLARAKREGGGDDEV